MDGVSNCYAAANEAAKGILAHCGGRRDRRTDNGRNFLWRVQLDRGIIFTVELPKGEEVDEHSGQRLPNGAKLPV